MISFPHLCKRVSDHKEQKQGITYNKNITLILNNLAIYFKPR